MFHLVKKQVPSSKLANASQPICNFRDLCLYFKITLFQDQFGADVIACATGKNILENQQQRPAIGRRSLKKLKNVKRVYTQKPTEEPLFR